MIEEAIILAGGLGTRLRPLVSEVPKPMAPVGGKPFLEYLLRYVESQGIRHVILAVGYKHEVIQQHFGSRLGMIALTYAVEQHPLGTGGAIAAALSLVRGAATFVLNGDTFLQISYQELCVAWRGGGTARMAMAVRPEEDTARYGRCVVMDGRIAAFLAAGEGTAGFVNAGIYLLPTTVFHCTQLPEHFSFEQDFLVPYVDTLRPTAFVCDAPFLDIGIPEAYSKAQSWLPGRAGMQTAVQRTE